MSTRVRAPDRQAELVVELVGLDAGGEGSPFRGREVQRGLRGVLGIADRDAAALDGDLHADFLAAVGETGFPEVPVGEPDIRLGFHGTTSFHG